MTENEQIDIVVGNRATDLGKKAHTFACVRCSDKKVKCDRQDPCSTCVRHNYTCISRIPGPPRRKRAHDKDDMIEQVKRIKALLCANGIGLAQSDGSLESTRPEDGSSGPAKNISPSELARHSAEQYHSPRTTPTSNSSETRKAFRPQVLQDQDRTKFVDNSLWSRVAQEIRELGEHLEAEESCASSEMTEDDEAFHRDIISVFHHTSPIIRPAQPTSGIIRRLWSQYKSNVNPQFKLLHVPTMELALEKAVMNIEQIPRGFEALLFSIYSTAVLSLSSEDCKKEFGTSQSTLMTRYIQATEKALLRAKFMGTTSLVVLQALLHYLIAARTIYEPQTVWNLTGVVIRIAEGMGMRHDGDSLGLPPFETEMRRRLWWQLSLHDFRCAEMCGQAKFRAICRDNDQPEPPTNCDDSALYPGMSSLPVAQTGATEMLWVMFRTELFGFTRRQVASIKKAGINADVSPEEFFIMDDLDRKDRLIEEIIDLVETKHLRYCDPTKPLHLFTLLVARSTFKLMRFMCHHPRRWVHLSNVPEDEKELVWDLSVSILEYYDIMETNITLSNFKWNIPCFIQWQVVIHVLDTLRATPMRKGGDNAWTMIDSIYEHNSPQLLSLNRPIFLAVGSLCLKAVEAREQALEEAGKKLPTWPNYVNELRQRMELAKAKRVALVTARVKVATSETKQFSDKTAIVPETHEVQSGEPAPVAVAQTLQHASGQATANSTGNTTFNVDNGNNTIPSWPVTTTPTTHSSNTSYPTLSTACDPFHSSPANTTSFSQVYFQDPSKICDQPSFTNLLAMGPEDTGITEKDTTFSIAGSYYSLDTDTLLAHGLSMDTPAGQVVDWARWEDFFNASATGL